MKMSIFIVGLYQNLFIHLFSPAIHATYVQIFSAEPQNNDRIFDTKIFFLLSSCIKVHSIVLLQLRRNRIFKCGFAAQ